MSIIWVIHSTTKNLDADTYQGNTNAHFELIIYSGDEVIVKDFPNLDYDEREYGRTDMYQFDVYGLGVNPDARIQMRMKNGNDGWRPDKFFVIGLDVSGNYTILGAHPGWTEWFDRGANPRGDERHDIHGFSFPIPIT